MVSTVNQNVKKPLLQKLCFKLKIANHYIVIHKVWLRCYLQATDCVQYLMLLKLLPIFELNRLIDA